MRSTGGWGERNKKRNVIFVNELIANGITHQRRPNSADNKVAIFVKGISRDSKNPFHSFPRAGRIKRGSPSCNWTENACERVYWRSVAIPLRPFPSPGFCLSVCSSNLPLFLCVSVSLYLCLSTSVILSLSWSTAGNTINRQWIEAWMY